MFPVKSSFVCELITHKLYGMIRTYSLTENLFRDVKLLRQALFTGLLRHEL
jgi:hypothetical protein